MINFHEFYDYSPHFHTLAYSINNNDNNCCCWRCCSVLLNTIISATLIALISVNRLCRGWLSLSGINPSGAIQLQNKEKQIVVIILDISIIHYILLKAKAKAQCAYRQMQNMYTHNYVKQIIIIIYPLTARVDGAPQMISQPVFSTFPCSPLHSGTCRTPGLSIP